MTHDPKINILLSTYHGEKFLVQQLDSIFQQTYRNFSLYIRDDGSADGTLALLHSYMEQHPLYSDRIVILPNPSGQNLGYMGSFWTLLEQCEPADYYAFCDQDDVWLPDKLAAGITFLEKEDSALPLLYFSNYDYCDEELHVLHHAPSVSLPVTFRDVLFYTPAFGFSIMINESLRALALRTGDRTQLPHDGWVQKLAAAFGKILYNENSTALYRRHSSAVTASNARLISLICHWIRHDIFGSSMKETHFVLDRFLQEYGSQLRAEDFQLLTRFTGSSSSLVVRARRLFYPKKLRPSVGGDLALRICFLLNTY